LFGDGVADISDTIDGCADTCATRHINITVDKNDTRIISDALRYTSGIIGNIGGTAERRAAHCGIIGSYIILGACARETADAFPIIVRHPFADA
jgi:hypothetical protein